ncbi:hypothetical protein CDAR_597031 [Caerostris darwini]|uniref:Uncharacterized protein n=1 Tax=Caerostris darwini TaxID=1538125 RepID=A0AAV4U2E9_9ARAC|nr:hypothetical protein CDAR_597031 [Caerostris darwini]
MEDRKECLLCPDKRCKTATAGIAKSHCIYPFALLYNRIRDEPPGLTLTVTLNSNQVDKEGNGAGYWRVGGQGVGKEVTMFFEKVLLPLTF